MARGDRARLSSSCVFKSLFMNAGYARGPVLAQIAAELGIRRSTVQDKPTFVHDPKVPTHKVRVERFPST